MVVVDANGAFYVLLEAVNNIKCWLVGEEVILWSKDAVTSLASQPVSRTVQVCSVEEALAREQERGNCMHTLITNCSSHADAARSIGAHSVLVGASDSAADVGARIVSEVVRVRKAEQSGLLVVACAMKHSRQVDLCKQKLIYMQPEQGVMFCPIDPATGSCVRPAFDVLLVKATDFLEESLDATGNLSVEFQPHLQQLVKEAQAARKPVLDKLDCIRTVLDRRDTRKRLQHMESATDGLVRWAAAVLVPGRGAAESDAIVEMQSALQQGDALICKPCVACGIPQSHDMRLVWDAATLPPSMEVYPYLAECFHNHGGTVIKCYAIDDQVFLRAKPSLPDIVKHQHENENWSGRNVNEETQSCRSSTAPMKDTGNGEIAFHTLTNMPCVAAESVNTALVRDAKTALAAQSCAAVIRDATGLSLFGFDLTVPSLGEGYMLVDVNAFPSFKGIEGAAEALRVFLQCQCKL